MSFLSKILQNTAKIVANQKQQTPLTTLQAKIKLNNYTPTHLRHQNQPQVIAEIKPKSPSAGSLIDSKNPLEIARIYEQNGASALSVLTDTTFFGGSLELFDRIRSQTSLPLLRKDFIIDPYQVYQTKAHQADLILLIYKACSDNFAELLTLSLQLNLQPLVEVYDPQELDFVLPIINKLKAQDKIILGVNNRNLETFEVDYTHGFQFVNLLPKNLLKASLSGIQQANQAKELFSKGFDIVLIGQTAISNPNIITEIRTQT